MDKLAWVACNRCSKWRKLPRGVTQESLPDKWYCEDNLKWSPLFANCSVEQEPDDDDDAGAAEQHLPKPSPAPSSSNGSAIAAAAAAAPPPAMSPAFTPNPDLGVKESLVQLIRGLEATQRVITQLNADSDANEVYEKINSIPSALAQVSKSMEREANTTMQARIPHLLLDTVDHLLENNVSLFTQGELERIKALHDRVEMSAKRYRALHDEL